MSDAPTVPAAAPQQLPRVLGLWDGVGMVVGSIIGSGIFLKVSNVDKALQDFGFGPILGVWIVVGAVTLCGSLALAELAAMFPHAGGPYLYLREAYGRLPAFLWGWTEFRVVRAGSVGALSCATALYLNRIIPLSELGQECVAIAIVIGLSIANMLSTRWGASLMNFFAVVKLLFLAGLIVLPTLLGHANVSNWQPIWQAPASSGSFLTAVAAAMLAVMWPYDGWMNLTPVAEDMREPQRNVPRSLGLGLLIVIGVYVGANLSYHLVMPVADAAQSQTIAADVCRVMFGEFGATLAAAGVMCSTFGAANSTMICGPRIYLAMARDGMLPAALHRLHSQRQTPANAILIQGVWTVILIAIFFAWPGDAARSHAAQVATATAIHVDPAEAAWKAFNGLTDSVVIAGLVFLTLTVAAVYVLRFTRPEAERPYRTWGYPVTPLLLIAIYGFVLVKTLLDEWQKTAGVLGLIAAGVVYYVVVGLKKSPSTT